MCGAVSYETVIGISVARSDHNLDVTFVLSDAGTATKQTRDGPHRDMTNTACHVSKPGPKCDANEVTKYCALHLPRLCDARQLYGRL